MFLRDHLRRVMTFLRVVSAFKSVRALTAFVLLGLAATRPACGSENYGPPAVTTYWYNGFSELQMWVTGNYDGHLYAHYFNQSGWHTDDHGTGSNGVPFLSAPAVTTYWDGNFNQLQVWGTDPDGNLSLRYLDQSGWHTGGSGTNTYTVNQPMAFQGTTLRTWLGVAIVNVLAVGVSGYPNLDPLTISNAVIGGSDTVNLGAAGNGGSMQSIYGLVSVTNTLGTTNLNLNDKADTISRMVAITAATVTGLSPNTINYSQIGTLTINGGSGNNTLVGPASDTTWNITGNISGALSSNVASVAFSNFPNLTGQAGTDKFVFGDAATITGTINGGGEADTIDTTSYLAGQFFSITGDNAGTGTPVGSFVNIPNLIGGAGRNTFAFGAAGKLDANLNGGAGAGNTLEYSGGWTSDVLVNLQTGKASGVGSAISGFRNVIGASGGGAGFYNILVGNGGNELQGGNGRRNLLIAGATSSVLLGGNDDDILIGGTIAYDQEANMASLIALMSYWASTTDTYATRVANLLTGAGVPLLDATTVHNNGAGDVLLGHNGGAGDLNLYYGLALQSDETDCNPGIGEQFINV